MFSLFTRLMFTMVSFVSLSAFAQAPLDLISMKDKLQFLKQFQQSSTSGLLTVEIMEIPLFQVNESTSSFLLKQEVRPLSGQEISAFLFLENSSWAMPKLVDQLKQQWFGAESLVRFCKEFVFIPGQDPSASSETCASLFDSFFDLFSTFANDSWTVQFKVAEEDLVHVLYIRSQIEPQWWLKLSLQ